MDSQFVYIYHDNSGCLECFSSLLPQVTILKPRLPFSNVKSNVNSSVFYSSIYSTQLFPTLCFQISLFACPIDFYLIKSEHYSCILACIPNIYKQIHKFQDMIWGILLFSGGQLLWWGRVISQILGESGSRVKGIYIRSLPFPIIFSVEFLNKRWYHSLSELVNTP